MKSSKSQKGSSLITVVISAAILSFLIVGAGTALDHLSAGSSSQLSSSSECRDLAKNILRRIRSSGGASKVYKAPIDEDSVLLNDLNWQAGETTYQTEKVLTENDSTDSNILFNIRWPDQKIVEWTPGSSSVAPSVSHAPRTVFSYMNALATVFNLDNSVCTNLRGRSIDSLGVDSWKVANQSSTYDVEAFIRIRPYNLETGVYNCSFPGGLWPRPYGQLEPPAAVQDGILDLSNYDPDWGFEVEVTLKLDRDLEPKDLSLIQTQESERIVNTDCSSVEKFSYDSEKNTVPPPTIENVGGQLVVSVPETYSLGYQLLCRADSNINDYSIDYSGAAAAPGVRGPGDDWVPCDRITTLCGVDIGPAQINPEHTSVTYTAPSVADCAYGLEAVIIDAVGNSSDIMPLNGHDTTPTYDNGPTAGGRGAGPFGYRVDGQNYSSLQSAMEAAERSGRSINQIPAPVSNPVDEWFNPMEDQIQIAEDQAGVARDAAAAAGVSLGNIQSMASAAASAMSSASIDISAGQAVVDSIQASVSSASAAVSAAKSAVDAAKAAESTFATEVDFEAKATRTGAKNMSDTALSDAEAALAEAEAALLAAEAALQAMQDKKDELESKGL